MGKSTASASKCDEPAVHSVGPGLTVYVAVNQPQCDHAIQRLLAALGDQGVLGLDVEFLAQQHAQLGEADLLLPSTPHEEARRRNIRAGRDPLLQLGTPSVAVLVRLCFFTQLPDALHELVQRKDLFFVGVEISEDVQRLRSHWQLRVRNCCDLRYVCHSSRKFGQDYDWDSGLGLKSIASFLGQSIDDGVPNNKKGYQAYRLGLKCSNWAAPVLTHKQVAYAAKDAMAAAGSYVRLISQYCTFSGDQQWTDAASYYRRHFNRNFHEPHRDKSKHKKMNRKQMTHAAGFADDDERLTGKSYKKLRDTRNCSDSDLDMDFADLARQKFQRMKSQPRPALTYFVCAQQRSVFGPDSPSLVIETELLDWLQSAQVHQLNMSVHTKKPGQRIGMVLEMLSDEEA